MVKFVYQVSAVSVSDFKLKTAQVVKFVSFHMNANLIAAVGKSPYY